MTQTTQKLKTAGTSSTKKTGGSQKERLSIAPLHEDIARRAYGFYVESGCQPGHCEENWLRAESELRDAVVPAKTR